MTQQPSKTRTATANEFYEAGYQKGLEDAAIKCDLCDERSSCHCPCASELADCIRALGGKRD